MFTKYPRETIQSHLQFFSVSELFQIQCYSIEVLCQENWHPTCKINSDVCQKVSCQWQKKSGRQPRCESFRRQISQHLIKMIYFCCTYFCHTCRTLQIFCTQTNNTIGVSKKYHLFLPTRYVQKQPTYRV